MRGCRLVAAARAQFDENYAAMAAMARELMVNGACSLT